MTVVTFLPTRMGLPSKPIDEDRPCTNCGYNLRGLRASSRCPECGTPVFRRAGRSIDLCDLAPGTIRKFSLGFYLAAATLTGVLVLVFVSWRLGWSAEAYAAAVTLLSFVWFAAVWLMTTPLDIPPEQRLGSAWELKVRAWARGLQAGWFLNAIIAWIVVVSPPAGGLDSVLIAAHVATELAGVIGVALLCLLLANFSAWVRDEFAEKCFNYAFGGMVIISPVLFFFIPLFMTLLPLLFLAFIFLWFVWVGALFAFPLGLWSLGRSLAWAVRHSKDRIDRSVEIAESLAPEPVAAAHAKPAPTDEPIPLEGEASGQPIRYSMSQADPGEGAEAESRPMRRDRYDHERGDARRLGGESAQPDIF